MARRTRIVPLPLLLVCLLPLGCSESEEGTAALSDTAEDISGATGDTSLPDTTGSGAPDSGAEGTVKPGSDTGQPDIPAVPTPVADSLCPSMYWTDPSLVVMVTADGSDELNLVHADRSHTPVALPWAPLPLFWLEA